MKLQLNEKTLNAYINKALKQELNENNMDELFGSRNRKKNIRAITGQGWGNQNRDTKNFWGAANSDISNTDAESEAPQTLVGIVTKMEKQLMDLEKVIGIAPQAENLGASITQTRNNGGVKTKASLLAAINALNRISDRLSVVEKQTGMNSIMEAKNLGQIQNIDGMNMRQLAKALKARDFSLDKNTGNWLWKGSANDIATNSMSPDIKQAAQRYLNLSQTPKGPGLVKRVGTAVTKPFKTAGTAVGTATKGAMTKVGSTTIGSAFGGGAVGGALAVASIAAACFAIAQTAATIATKGRSRNIVRTFNCASILAKRMGNVAEAYKEKLEAQQGIQTQQNPETQQETGQVNELNVGRAKKSFGSIEQGMQQLSALMKQIHAKINGQGQSELQMPKSLNTPQEIQQFQEWANANGYVDQSGQQLAVDGKFGQRTSYVYDQVAQKLGQLQESRGQINEAGGIENALKTLERKVGTTGTGGAAYADISTLSGGQGQGSSRLQNAQNAKVIMRSYPPVLNQYLQILKSAGANVNNLLPLRDDQSPHRNYSVKELQTIDRRIQELIQVAQSFEPQQSQENVTLPPKPVRRQNPNPNPNPTPAQPELPELEIPEIEDEPIEIENVLMNLDSTMPEVPFMANPYTLESYGIIPNDKTGRITKRELKDKIRNAMAQGKLTPERAQELIRQVRQDYRNGVSQRYTNPDGTTVDTTDNARRATNRANRQATRETNRANRQAMRDANQAPEYISESRVRRKKLNENQFKRLVKQIIRESLR